MKQTVQFTDFRDAFKAYGRITDFSYKGAKALFGYIEELEDGTGEQIELDVIALCREFTEYEDARQCVLDAEYQFNFTNACGYDATYDEENEACLEYLQDNTIVIEFEDGIIIQDF